MHHPDSQPILRVFKKTVRVSFIAAASNWFPKHPQNFASQLKFDGADLRRHIEIIIMGVPAMLRADDSWMLALHSWDFTRVAGFSGPRI